MKVKTTHYLVIDCSGEKFSFSVDDRYDTIQVSLLDKEGEVSHFEAEAYHFPAFCERTGVELRVIESEQPFDSLWNQKDVTLNWIPFDNLSQLLHRVELIRKASEATSNALAEKLTEGGFRFERIDNGLSVDVGQFTNKNIHIVSKQDTSLIDAAFEEAGVKVFTKQ